MRLPSVPADGGAGGASCPRRRPSARTAVPRTTRGRCNRCRRRAARGRRCWACRRRASKRGEAEADAAEDHALAQVGPRRAAADLLRLLVERRGRRRRGRVAAASCRGERAQRLGRRHDALFGELQHRLVQHPRLAHPVPEDEARSRAPATGTPAATIMTTMNASPGSVWAKSLNESYSRSSPKTPTRTRLPCLPWPIADDRPTTRRPRPRRRRRSSCRTGVDFSMVTIVSGLVGPDVDRGASRVVAILGRGGVGGGLGGAGAGAAAAGAAAVRPGRGRAGDCGGRATAKARKTASPRTSRRTRRGGLAAAKVAGCMGSPWRRLVADWMRRTASADSKVAGRRIAGQEALGVRAIIPENGGHRENRPSGADSHSFCRAPSRCRNLMQRHNGHRHPLDFEYCT